MDDHTKRKIQSYGEQHPDFHSKEMKEYRKGDKAAAKKKELAKKIKRPHGKDMTPDNAGSMISGMMKRLDKNRGN